jgi:hypothetical protein
MKKLFTFIALSIFFSSTTSQAQTQKGAVILGTSANLLGGYGNSAGSSVSFAFGKTTYKSGSVKESANFSIFNISPMAGYFVANNFMIGASLGYLHLNDDDDDATSITSFTPMLRYYFKTPKIRPYLEARAGLSRQKFDPNFDANNSTLISIKGGGAYFINNHVSLDVYIDFVNELDDDDNNSIFGLGFGFSYFLK